MYRLAGAIVLDLSADTFLLFALFWIAEPQGWTGVATALLVIALRLPALPGGWLGGRAIERYGPLPPMLVQAGLRIACLITLTCFSWSGQFSLALILILGGLSGAVLPVSYAGARTLVPQHLSSSDLIRANSLLAVGDQAALVVGAAFIGPLLGAVGAGPALLVPIAMLGVASLLFLTLPRTANPVVDPLADEGQRGSSRGLPSPWRMRPVLGLVLLSTVYYFAYGPFEPVMPYFTREQLNTGTGAYSLIWIGMGLGALAGLSQAERLSRFSPGVVNAAGMALWGLVTLPLVFCRSIVPAVAVMVISGAIWGPYLAVEATALQRWVAPARHGRVFGTQHAVLAVANPLGAAAGSIALSHFSSANILAAVTVGCLIAGLLALTSPAIRHQGEISTQ
jgi:predicted MFS family arabinose efflux permease